MDGGEDDSRDRRDRLVDVWGRVVGLGWPVSVEHTTRTAMRTTDVVVTGFFSPAAIAAIGLADLYARFPLRIGLGLGGGAIALSSQDTGADAGATRDEAVTQALVLGALSGIPFILAGVTLARPAIEFLGAGPKVATMGGTYLAVVFATAPARHVALIGARALQGTGDTRTPMYVNIVANLGNVTASVVLGLGLFGAPRLEILGVGLATAGANVFAAGVFVLAIASGRTRAGFVRPADPTIARQLVAVSAPKVGEGLLATLADFPFNALLLGFGTEVNAAWQVGRRAYQQVTAPVARGLNVAANVLVGQALGAGDTEGASFAGWATAALGGLVVGAVGVGLFVGAPEFVAVFTDDALTAGYAVDFARTYAVVAPVLVGFLVLSGALQGGSDTKTPFYARVSGAFGLKVCASYLLGVGLGIGVLGVYVGLAASFLWMAFVVGYGFRFGDWADRATAMMAERGSLDANDETETVGAGD